MKKTLVNLAQAFVGESQARNRYTMFASKARKEGYLQIATIFEETAEQEKEHASRFMKMFLAIKEKEGLDMEIQAVETEVFVKLGSTLENLGYAVAGETHEFEQLYPMFAKVALEEGYPEVAVRIKAIMNAEMHHAERYQKLHTQIKNETIRNKSEEIEWICTKCGHTHKGKKPPKACPSCGHEEEYFIVKCENY
ncbi:rubrerythrin [candidate division SR1 bacterium RAAC1_SR1_1]|nr:rubrerythrin [candidate division SR1 bacterium RAAC1_SR1_1]